MNTTLAISGFLPFNFRSLWIYLKLLSNFTCLPTHLVLWFLNNSFCVKGPKLLATFCCGCKEGECTMGDNASTSGPPQFNIILQGLADCVASHGSVLQVTCLLRTPFCPWSILKYQINIWIRKIINTSAMQSSITYCCNTPSTQSM